MTKHKALTEFLTKKYEEKYPYIYKSDIKKQPKEPKPEKETNDDAYVGYLKGAFSKNRTSSIQNLNAIAGNNAKIKEVKDGLQVKYKPIITISAGGVPMIIENPIEETRIAKNAGELASILRSANVTGAGAKVISSVGGAAPKQEKSKKPDVIQNGHTFRWNGTKYVFVK